MNGFITVFLNECRAILRSKSLLFLLIATVAWMFAAPHLFTGDGTLSGLREMSVHYSLGGVAAMLAITLLVAATGSIARERAAKRLALTMVRPVRYFSIALGKILAYVLCGALVLSVGAVIEFIRQPDVQCRHVLQPVMQSVAAEAEEMYAYYMASSNTPAKAKSAKKEVVLRLLANRAKDRYDNIETNSTWTWKFDLANMPALDSRVETPTVRFRFSAMYDHREEVNGDLSFGPYSGVVSNITQAVIEVPLAYTNVDGAANELTFRNNGKTAVMLRPRRDVELLLPADGFRANIVRAYLELVSMLALLIAFGVFLGSALGRPAALFTALATLLLSEMAPSVVDAYVDQLETDKADAIGLAMTRAAAAITQPVSSLRPMEALSLDECVEPREVLATIAIDLVCLPLFFALLSAFVMPRKQD